MNKIVVCIMGQDCKDFLEICLRSVEGADAIVFCDGGSKQEFLEWLLQQGFRSSDKTDIGYGAVQYGKTNRYIIQQEFKQDDPEMNGKQRNFYLDFLKQHYAGWWCLCLDADEFIDDFNKVKKFTTDQHPSWEETLFSPKMRHLFHNFRYEDATQPEHFVPNRFFRVRDTLKYPLGEHVILQEDDADSQPTNSFVVWHLAYAPLFHVRQRMRKNLLHSNVHKKEFLDQWYRAHLFGKYPVREVNPKDLPPVLLRAFDIDPDEIYFADRGLEVKHFIDAGNWREFFKCKTALEFGAGRGPRVTALNVVGVKTKGVELSIWAVTHGALEYLTVGDVTSHSTICELASADLVIAYDLLEHISYKNLECAINNLIDKSSKHILISVPVLGDPNLENDPTHIIRESKDWWRKQFIDKGCKEVPVPEYFLYRDQQMIFEVPVYG